MSFSLICFIHRTITAEVGNQLKAQEGLLVNVFVLHCELGAGKAVVLAGEALLNALLCFTLSSFFVFLCVLFEFCSQRSPACQPVCMAETWNVHG